MQYPEPAQSGDYHQRLNQYDEAWGLILFETKVSAHKAYKGGMEFSLLGDPTLRRKRTSIALASRNILGRLSDTY